MVDLIGQDEHNWYRENAHWVKRDTNVKPSPFPGQLYIRLTKPVDGILTEFDPDNIEPAATIEFNEYPVTFDRFQWKQGREIRLGYCKELDTIYYW